MTSIGRICIYVYISSNTRIYFISPQGFIQEFVSATLLQGCRAKKKIYIYNATPGGGVEQKKIIYIYICCARPPLLPVRRECAGCGQWGLDRCQCQVEKKWNTWGQVQGTPGGEVKGTPGGEVGIHKGDN